MPSPQVILTNGVNDHETGRPTQSHLIYAANTGRWWVFWIDSTNLSLLRARVSSSPDLSTAIWSDGTPSPTYSGTSSNPSGSDLAVGYKSIAGVDVVHLTLDRDNNGTRTRTWIRATIDSATTLAWGAWSDTVEPFNNSAFRYGPACAFSSDNRVFVATNMFNGNGNCWVTASLNPDLGASWVSGFATAVQYFTCTQTNHANALFDIGNGNMLVIGSDGENPATDNQCVWEVSSGTTWAVRGAAAFGVSSAQDPNDWGACAYRTNDVHFVRRTGPTTFDHQRFNGTTWVAGDPLPSSGLTGHKPASGLFVGASGGNVWLVLIDGDVGNSIRYSMWTSGFGWGVWTTVPTNSNVKNMIAGWSQAPTNQVNIIWTEGTTLFNVVGATIQVPASSASLSATTTLIAASTGQVGMFFPASDTVAGTWTTDQGSSAGLFSRVNEMPPSDANFDQSSLQPNSDSMVLAFPPLSPLGGNIFLHVRYSKDTPGDTDDLTVELIQAGTPDQFAGIPGNQIVVQSWTLSDIATAWNQLDALVSNPITDWSNLMVRFTARVMLAGVSATSTLSASGGVAQSASFSTSASLVAQRSADIVLEPLAL